MTSFGFRKFDETYLGANDGIAFICIDIPFFVPSPTPTVTWRRGTASSPGDIIKGPTDINGDTSDFVENLEPGDYVVIFTSEGSVVDEIDFTILASNMVLAESLNICIRQLGGKKLKALVNNGNPPFTYEWKNLKGCILSTNKIIKDIPAGIYTLRVTDANGCQGFKCYEFAKWNPIKIRSSKNIKKI